MTKRSRRFAVTRHGEPIQTHYLRDAINPGINYSDTFAIWDAAIAAGATLDELQELHTGKYSSRFLAHLVAWNALKNAINSNVEDAKSEKLRQRQKK